MKNLFKVIALSVVTMLVAVDAQAADAKTKASIFRRAANRVSTAASSVSGSVSTRAGNFGSAVARYAGKARSAAVNVAKKGFAKTKSLAATAYDYTASAAQAVGRFARRPVQFAAGALLIGGLYNVRSPVVARVSDRARFYWSCRGEVLPYLKAKAKSAYNTTREYAALRKPSRNQVALGLFGVAAAVKAYDYVTTSAKKKKRAARS